MKNTQYKLQATNIDGDIELLFSSGIKAECQEELDAERRQWKQEGYKGFSITPHATDVEPVGWTQKAIKDIKQGSVFVKTTSGAMFTRGEYDREYKDYYCEPNQPSNLDIIHAVKGSKIVWASDYL
tara:strand:+ start:133 stop:510 length:378 start_codon:yes stop_codon:yes gene_type:complete